MSVDWNSLLSAGTVPKCTPKQSCHTTAVKLCVTRSAVNGSAVLTQHQQRVLPWCNVDKRTQCVTLALADCHMEAGSSVPVHMHLCSDWFTLRTGGRQACTSAGSVPWFSAWPRGVRMWNWLVPYELRCLRTPPGIQARSMAHTQLCAHLSCCPPAPVCFASVETKEGHKPHLEPPSGPHMDSNVCKRRGGG